MSVDLNNPIYDGLKTASTKDLIAAAIIGYTPRWPDTRSEGLIEGLRIALKIIGTDGWMQIAPIWLEAFRESKGEGVKL